MLFAPLKRGNLACIWMLLLIRGTHWLREDEDPKVKKRMDF